MTAKRKVQVAVDLFMTALLPILMSYELVGQATHEWAGVVMFAFRHHIRSMDALRRQSITAR